MRSSLNNGDCWTLGCLTLLTAVFLQNITLASEKYGAVLLAALGFTLIADLCFMQTFRRGGVLARSFSLVLLLPTLFVVGDFVRRMPGFV